MSLTIPILCISDAFYFYRVSFFLNFLYLLSLDKSDSLDDESDNDGSDSRSSGTYSSTNFICVFKILLVM